MTHSWTQDHGAPCIVLPGKRLTTSWAGNGLWPQACSNVEALRRMTIFILCNKEQVSITVFWCLAASSNQFVGYGVSAFNQSHVVVAPLLLRRESLPQQMSSVVDTSVRTSGQPLLQELDRRMAQQTNRQIVISVGRNAATTCSIFFLAAET